MSNGGTPKDLDDLVEILRKRYGTVLDWNMYAKADIHDYIANVIGAASLEADKFGPEVVDFVMGIFARLVRQRKDHQSGDTTPR